MNRWPLTRGHLVVFVLGMAVTAVIVAVIAAALSSAVTTDQIRDTQVDNTEKNDKQTQVLKIIRSCTSPGGECYERSQRRTAKAVGDIGRYVLLSAACAAAVSADEPVDQRIAAITDCVMKRLAR